MLALQFKHYEFKPAWFTSAVTVVLLYIMVSMALWQIDRADYKSNLQTIIEARKNLSPIGLNNVKTEQDAWLYQPVYTEGRWDLAHQILLDNQVHKGNAGYRVYTPLKVTDSKALLVDRGWIATGLDRNQLPDLSFDSRAHSLLSGILTPPPSKGLVLSEQANSLRQQWPLRLQYLNINELQASLGYELLPYVLQLDASQTKLDVLPIKVNMRSEKHTAYAFQWFALSLALITIYIVVNTKKVTENKITQSDNG